MDGAMHASTKVKHLPPPPPQPFNFPPSPQNSLGSSISPSILLIIVILAVIFFISGLLHLLIRYLMRPISRDPDEMDSATALEGQLQQLFHLHDAGVDQTFIDTLPIFLYRAIIGLKDPFDCAVCLCEFEGDDKLRLLPKCSHAFHLDCIDTWLLSHSTCPLCRTSLLSDFNSPSNSCCSPSLVLVLESAAASESSREICPEETVQSHTQLGLATDDELGPKAEPETTPEAKVVAVKLGKIKNVDVGSSDGKLDGRRCHSMGSYEYVMDESSQLQVAINPSKRKPGTKKPNQRLAMSECDPHSRRGFKANFESSRNSVVPIGGDARITARKECFSVSKIWMRPGRGEMIAESSRRAHSFRLPLQRQSSDGSKLMIAGVEKCGSEVDLDVEVGSCNYSTVGSVASEAPSFTTRTLLWIMGRQSKVGSLG